MKIDDYDFFLFKCLRLEVKNDVFLVQYVIWLSIQFCDTQVKNNIVSALRFQYLVVEMLLIISINVVTFFFYSSRYSRECSISCIFCSGGKE